MYAVPMRHTTPPSYSHQAFYGQSLDCQYSNPGFYSSTENSPDSIITNTTSPQRSPRTTIRHGPQLLPKIRCQDQTVEPISTAGSVIDPRLHVPTIRTAFPCPPSYYRRGTSPPEGLDLQSPASACSLPASVFSNALSSHSALTAVTAPLSAVTTTAPYAPLAAPRNMGPTPSPLNTNVNSPIHHTHSNQVNPSRRSSLAHVRSVSGTRPPSQGHSRSTSQSSVDEAALLKHGYPTQYRQMPQYITAASQVSASTTMSMPAMAMGAESLDLYMSSHDTGLLSPDMHMGSMMPSPVKTTTLLSYLTHPCPCPSLIARSLTDSQRHWDYGWWDVRNLRSWTDFSVEKIMAVPEFPNLLQLPLEYDSLPHPQPTSASPEHEFQLRDVFLSYFGTRINAALKSTLGQGRMELRANNSASLTHTPKPDFISTRENDVLKTLRGEDRGHLVGIVKAYDEWNTGMRAESAPQQVKYLRGLAQLHRIMREHGCRYGFIITEIELLCVRAAAEDGPYFASKHNPNPSRVDEGPKPIFGMLETAAPVSLRTAGPDPATGAARMTAGLALWFLHVLAKDEPLPGYAPWKMDVGGPAAVTRQNCRPRDSWMPKVVATETRPAKRLRGWVYPEEPFNRREAPPVRRRRG